MVLGMHRSGTSALTRVLSLLGAELPHILLPPTASNETGYWESSELKAIHDQVLSSGGSDWCDWRAFNPDWYTTAVAPFFKLRILEILRRDLRNSQLFVIKDPRICRLWPLWREILEEFGAKPAVVIPVRNPLEVMNSLRERDGFISAKSCLLWLRHVIDAESATRGLPRAVVTYDSLLKDWQSVASTLESRLGVRWPKRGVVAEVEIERFLATRFRHHLFGPGQLAARADMVDWAKEAFAAMLQMSVEPEHKGSMVRLDRIRVEFEKAATAFGVAISDVEIRLTKREAEYTQLRTASGALQQRVSDLSDEQQRLTANAEAATAKLNDAHAELSAERQRLAEQADRLNELRALNKVAEASHTAAAEEASRLTFEGQELRRRISDLSDDQLRQHTEAAATAAKLNDELTEVLKTLSAERQNAAERSDRLADLEERQVIIAASLETAREENRRFRAEREDLLRRISDLSEQQWRLGRHAELSAAKSKEELCRVLTTLSAERQKAAEQSDRLSYLEERLTAAAGEHAVAAEEAGQLRADLTRLRAELVVRSDELRRLATDASTSESRVVRLNEECAVQAAQIAVLRNALSAARAQSSSLGSALEVRSARLVQLESDAETMRNIIAALDSIGTTNSGEIAQLHTRLSEANKRADNFEASFKSVSRELRAIKLTPTWRLMRPIRHIQAELRRLSNYRLIARSGVFDRRWYVTTYPDVDAAGYDPIFHYVDHGAAEGRDPSPLFDGAWYLAENPDVRGEGINPLVHYLRHGTAEGRDPHPLFDVSYYLDQYPECAGGVNPVVDFCLRGAQERRDPHPLFNVNYYVNQSLEAAASKNPLIHYLQTGAKEGLDPNPLFSTCYYLLAFPEVETSGLNPLVHFVRYGAKEGKRPHPMFDTGYYLAQCPDLASAGANALAHYLLRGDAEHRRPNPLFNGEFYLKENDDVAGASMCSLSHFVAYGASEGRHGWTAQDAVKFIEPYVVNPELSKVGSYFSQPSRLNAHRHKLHVGIYTNSSGNYFFDEIRDLLVAGFKSIGIDSIALTEHSKRPDSITHDLFVAPHEFFYCSQQGHERLGFLARRTSITLNTEQLHSQWFSRSLPSLLKTALVLDVNFHTATALRALGLNAWFLPLGYLESFQPYSVRNSLPDLKALASLSGDVSSYQPANSRPLKERPIDILFIGTTAFKKGTQKVTTRRELFFSQHAGRFCKFHCFFHFVCMDGPLVQAKNAELTTEAVIGLCQRSKIILNINSGEMPYFQWQRIVLHGMWQGALIVSETCHPVPGLIPGVHYYEGKPEEIPKAIEWFLRDAEGIEAAEGMRNAALSVLKSKFDLSNILSNLVEKLVVGSQI
jgi:hypothetical protein